MGLPPDTTCRSAGQPQDQIASSLEIHINSNGETDEGTRNKLAQCLAHYQESGRFPLIKLGFAPECQVTSTRVTRMERGVGILLHQCHDDDPDVVTSAVQRLIRRALGQTRDGRFLLDVFRHDFRMQAIVDLTDNEMDATLEKLGFGHPWALTDDRSCAELPADIQRAKVVPAIVWECVQQDLDFDKTCDTKELFRVHRWRFRLH